MRKEEEEIAEGDPCPTLFYEELVEYVALLGEVGGCGAGEVGLCRCVVGGSSSGWIEEGEEGSYHEGHWVDGQQDAFESSWEERRSS